MIIKQTGPGGFAEGQSNNTSSGGKNFRVFLYHRLTDYYGSIPYSEAMKADEGMYFPKYDKQRISIYQDLLKELDEATAAITDPTDAKGEVELAAMSRADIIFNGDLDKWRKMGLFIDASTCHACSGRKTRLGKYLRSQSSSRRCDRKQC